MNEQLRQAEEILASAFADVDQAHSEPVSEAQTAPTPTSFFEENVVAQHVNLSMNNQLHSALLLAIRKSALKRGWVFQITERSFEIPVADRIYLVDELTAAYFDFVRPELRALDPNAFQHCCQDAYRDGWSTAWLDKTLAALRQIGIGPVPSFMTYPGNENFDRFEGYDPLPEDEAQPTAPGAHIDNDIAGRLSLLNKPVSLVLALVIGVLALGTGAFIGMTLDAFGNQSNGTASIDFSTGKLACVNGIVYGPNLSNPESPWYGVYQPLTQAAERPTTLTSDDWPYGEIATPEVPVVCGPGLPATRDPAPLLK